MKNGLRVLSLTVILAMIFTVMAPVIAFADEETSAENVLLTAPATDATSSEETASDAAGDDVTEETTAPEEGTTSDVVQQGAYSRENSYENFMKKYGSSPRPDQVITIPAAGFVKDEGASPKVETYEGKDNVLVWDSQSGKLTWQFDVAEEGLYNLAMSYITFLDNSLTISFELKIDGLTQFNSMKNFEFNRVFKNSLDEFKEDNRGNQLRPSQEQVAIWQKNVFNDAEGIYNEGFYFLLTPGSHTMTLEMTGAGIAIENFEFFQVKEAQSYEEYKAQFDASDVTATKGETIELEGEHAILKSDSMLSPQNDRSDPLTQPYSPSKIKMNIIGGDKWQRAGQWARWEFEVEQDGWYKIGLRYVQNYLRGMATTRTVRIDGEVPFKEMNAVSFGYTNSYALKTLGVESEDGKIVEPYYFYLTAGKHTIELEASLGDLAASLQKIDDVVYEMNYLYRKIIMITSTTPDQYRNYKLDEKINDLIPRLNQISRILKEEYETISAIMGGKGSEAAVIEKIYAQIDSFVEKPYTISQRLSVYKENISTLSAWLLTAMQQPIGLDYIMVTPAGEEFKDTTANWWQKTVHEVRAFIASFTEDYTSIGSVAGEDARTITVWIGTGRDQANVLKAMIDDDFAPNHNIAVNLNLVQGSLVQAIASGRNPDVQLSVGGTEPMNLAVRGALYDLTEFEGFKDVSTRFHEGAMNPYMLNGGVYALPETQTFGMMYYRTDILEELGLEVPQTWQDIYDLLPIVQRNNMEVGCLDIYSILLYQAGGEYYNEDYTEVGLTEKVGVDTFIEYTDLFTQYKLPNAYDFFNRFRTGEMPIGISVYNSYNQFSTAAPEISGLWGMTLVPGTEMPDGTINRTQTATVTANIMLKTTKDPQASWEFLDWFTSAQTQARYGAELEAAMGQTARYATANLEAFSMLDWSREDRNIINAQREFVVHNHEVPGSYYLARNITNAFNATVTAGEDPRTALKEWSAQTDAELERKRNEFGVDKFQIETVIE